MANETNTKVRLVRCPKCQQILQEHAEIPIYKCGGCATILQAKKRRNDNTGSVSCTHKTTPPANAEVDEEKFPVDLDTSIDQNNPGARKIKSCESSGSLKQNLSFTQRSNRRDRNNSEGINSENIETANGSREIFSTDFTCDNIEMPSRLHRESTSSESAVQIHHRDILKFPTTRSYYAYDGSASSWDLDDQVSNQFPQHNGQIFGSTGFNSPDKFQFGYVCSQNNILRRKSKMQNQAMNFSPMSPQKIQPDEEGSDELESRRHVRATGNRRTALPFDMKFSHTMSECGSPSACGKNVVHCQSDFTDPEQERMELLRMIYELEDQLHKTRLGNGKANDMFQEMNKLRLREKYAKRRHVLPVASGAPIIVCYYCLELLHMPADFAVFKRRCHQMRCNACTKVLKFSIKNKTNVIPYLAVETSAPPPPSEVDDDISNTTKGPSSKWGPSESEVDDISDTDKGRNENGFPLHHLMGYSSLSQVLNG